MRVPKTMDVFGVEYKIKRSAVVECEGVEVDGLCDHETKTIEVRKGSSSDTIDQVFLHECFHAALYEAGVGRNLSIDIEETVVDCLSRFVVRGFKVTKKTPKK